MRNDELSLGAGFGLIISNLFVSIGVNRDLLTLLGIWIIGMICILKYKNEK